MIKWKVLLITSILLMNVLFLLPFFIYTPVKALDYGMDTDLGNVNASFWGEHERDSSGWPVAGAGDVNGDGYDDILIGAYCNDDGGDSTGQTYLIFGKPFGWSMDTDLSASDASFLGEDEGDYSGKSIAGAGDVNGDGFDDILIGAYNNDDGGDDAGQTYLIFGKASGWMLDSDLSASDASFFGEYGGDSSGCSVAGAGDVNGDGYDDILIGAYENDEDGFWPGQTYLIFGKASGWKMDTNLSFSDASFWGEKGGPGFSVAGAGDVNGDGYDDILIGAPGLIGWSGKRQLGQTFLIFGKASGWKMDTDLSVSDASFHGVDKTFWSGWSVAGAGDVDGDGYDDILIGVPGGRVDGNWSGISYLILGKASGWAMYTSLSASNASFRAEDFYDCPGYSVAGAGDVDGDGYDDILIGAPEGDNKEDFDAGRTYLIFPKHNFKPILYDENLSLSDGNVSSNITFSIMYEDNDDDKPINVSLVIDNKWYAMICNDSIPINFRKGVQYSHSLNLSKGPHRYFYSASDGKTSVRFPLKGYFIASTDLDGDGILDPFDYDRDGDEVANVDDPYPDDPKRWKNDTVPEPEDNESIYIWVGLILFAFTAGIIGLVIHIARKKRIEEGKISKTDDLGRVGKKE